MKVILDEGVPEPLARGFPGHEISTLRALGWKGIKNGKLLDLIEDSGFDAFLTNDKRMEAEQQLQLRPFAILILSACNWPVIRPHLDKIVDAVDHARPGTVTKIDCGTFVPLRFRRPGKS